MATKNGLYNDKVKGILGDKVDRYREEKANGDIALTRVSMETLEEKTLVYQREMLKTALKQEDYLKKIAKNTHHSLFDRIGKLAENIGNIKHTYDAFRNPKRFGAEALSGMCCCDGMGQRRGSMRRTRSGRMPRNTTVADNGGSIDDVRVRGSGAGLGTGESPRGRRRNARSTGYQTIKNSALLLSSKQFVRDWSRSTADMMSTVFRGNTREMQRSAATISKVTVREAGRFAKKGATATSGLIGTMASMLDNQIFRTVGKAAAAAWALWDFSEGRAQAEDLVGRKLSNFEKTKAGGYYAVDNFLLGLPSMLTELTSGMNFTKMMSTKVPTMGENFEQLTGVNVGNLANGVYDKFMGKVDTTNQTQGIGERNSRSFVDMYKNDVAKSYKEISDSVVGASLGSHLVPPSIKETLQDLKELTYKGFANEPVVDEVRKVQQEIASQTKETLKNDTTIAKKSFTNDQNILNAIKKWAGYPTDTAAASTPFTPPNLGGPLSGQRDIGLPGDVSNPRTGQSPYQKTIDGLANGTAFTNQLFKGESLGGSWVNGGFQKDGPLPGGFSGTAGNPNIRLSTTPNIGAKGKGGITSQLIDDMLSHPSKPSALLAKAIVGNMGVESAGTFDPNILGDGGKALGLMQWHPDRQAKLNAYAKEMGLDPRSTRAQALFAIEETVPNSPYADAGKRSSVTARKLIEAGNVDLNKATFLFGDNAERPANIYASLAERQRWAAKADKKYVPGGDRPSFAALAGDLSKRGNSISLPKPGSASDFKSPVAGVDINNLDQVPMSGGSANSRSFGGNRGRGKFHTGVDIPGKVGQGINATQDGVIRRIEKSDNGYGYVMDIEYPDGTVHRSAHMGSFADGLKVGSTVKAGQQVGTVGHSGNADESFPHNHFEVMKKDFYDKNGGRPSGRASSLEELHKGRIDPREYFKGAGTNVAGLEPKRVSTTRIGGETPSLVASKGNRVGYDPITARIDSAVGAGFTESYTGRVSKPDTSFAHEVPTAPSWAGSMGNEMQANMSMASPPAQNMAANIPSIQGIPNNADIADLLPLLYAEAVTK